MYKLPSRRASLPDLLGVLHESRVGAPRWIGVLLLLPAIMTGCGTMFPRYFGIRPDGPPVLPTSTEARGRCDEYASDLELRRTCLRYWSRVEWADQIGQSYRSRATMNEWAIYLAGTIALGTLSALGGLALAGSAANDTAGLLSVSSGFASGFFGFINNSARAGFYTQAANEIALARAKADQTVGTPPTPQTYTEAANLLNDAVTKWTTWLESKRYEAATAAASAAVIEQANRELRELQSVVESSAIVTLTPSTGPANTKVTLKTSGIDLQQHTGRLRLFVGGQRHQAFTVSDPNTLTFEMPSGTSGTTVSVRLHLGAYSIPGEGMFKYQ